MLSGIFIVAAASVSAQSGYREVSLATDNPGQPSLSREKRMFDGGLLLLSEDTVVSVTRDARVRAAP